MPRDWLLELGHSRLKLARRKPDGRPGATEIMAPAGLGQWLQAHRPERDERFWLAAVPGPAVTAAVIDTLDNAGMRWTRVVTGSAALPVAPSYAGMGVDRWLAVQPVRADVDGAFCVVDCGTATTVDVVDADGIHVGGWIMPGLDAARDGLVSRAPGLKRAAVETDDPLTPARDTTEAIERGLRIQQAGAVERLHRAAADRLGSALVLVITGGGAGSVQSLLEGARLEPDLVLRGLAMAAESLSET